jgi:hypothetical protein
MAMKGGRYGSIRKDATSYVWKGENNWLCINQHFPNESAGFLVLNREIISYKLP